MKQIATLALALSLTFTPAMAQEDGDADVTDGFSLMEEGARMLMRGLMSEMEPAIADLREGFEQMGPTFEDFTQAVGPALAELLNQVDDFRHYEAPEFLPNGDIIIRRSPDAPEFSPDPVTGEIEL